jgi:hydrogenase maturation protease
LEFDLKTLVLGYGNVDRQDDGVAWHVICEILRRLGHSIPEEIISIISPANDLFVDFQLQLTPEMAEELAKYDRICFIDAHTGSIPEEIHVENQSAYFHSSPLTHHLTASSLLAIIQTLYSKNPKATLISLRGYKFGFTRELSEDSQKLVTPAADQILQWVNQNVDSVL